MMARMIPESIKMKLKKRLEESGAGSDNKKEVIKRIRERLRAKLNEAKGDGSNKKIIERIRERLRARMDEARGSGGYDREFIRRIRRKLEERMRKRSGVLEELREKLRERIRRRMGDISEERSEGSVIERIRSRMRARRLGEGRAECSYDRKYIERIRRRIEERMNRSVGISEGLRRRLRERLAKLRERRDGGIIERIRERVRSRRVLSEGGSFIGNSRMMNLSDAGFDEEEVEDILDRIDMLLKSAKSNRIGEGISGKDLEFYKRALRRLKEESEYRKAMLKDAYKVIKRVEELGGIDKIEESLKLAYDTIVKTGSKMFKEAVDKLSAETGVKKEEAAKILRKLGLKEAKEVLKKGVKKVKDNKPEVVPVSGLVKEDEGDSPVIAKRLAERLARVGEIPGIGSLKEMTEVVFSKK